MKEKLETLLKEGTARIEATQSEAELQEVKGALLGKQGSITELLKEIPKLDVALRPEMGKAVNNVKALLTEQIENRREELKLKASAIPADFDCTVPGFEPKIGGLHPITQMCYDLNDAFRSMGFEVFSGPEITSEYYAFDNLNFPPITLQEKAWIHTGSRVTIAARQTISFVSVPTLQVIAYVICRHISPLTALYIPAEFTEMKLPMPVTSAHSSSMRLLSLIRISHILQVRL